VTPGEFSCVKCSSWNVPPNGRRLPLCKVSSTEALTGPTEESITQALTGPTVESLSNGSTDRPYCGKYTTDGPTVESIPNGRPCCGKYIQRKRSASGRLLPGEGRKSHTGGRFHGKTHVIPIKEGEGRESLRQKLEVIYTARRTARRTSYVLIKETKDV